MSARNYVSSPARFMDPARPALPTDSKSFHDAREKFLGLESRWDSLKRQRDVAELRADAARAEELDQEIAALDREIDQARSAFTHMRRHG